MKKTNSAVEFLKQASKGYVQTAFDIHIHPDFIHHNPYFRGDRQSLLLGMEQNAAQFPNKTYHVLRTLEDRDLVTVHGKVQLSGESTWSVIHIFRFEADQIIEAWEASQQMLPDAENEHGLF